MLKIRRSHDRLIFNMGIPISGKDGLYIETGPRGCTQTVQRLSMKCPGCNAMSSIIPYIIPYIHAAFT